MNYKPVLKDERIRIAFLFQIASFWPAWESFYLTCKTDARFDVRFYYVNDGVYDSNQTKSAETFLIENNFEYIKFSYENFNNFNPHVAVVQTPYEYYHRKPHLYAAKLKNEGIRVVYIPYGIEIADTPAARHDHFREPVIRNAWRVYTLSDDFAVEYKKYCDNYLAVRALGLPRFDMLINSRRHTLSRQIFEETKKRKIIVWHTHFAKKIDTADGKRQVTPYVDEYIQFAAKISQYADKMFFIFLPHPLFGDDAVDMENNRKSDELLKILSQTENVFIDKADDYRPSLMNCDAIITDRSALMVESAVTGVPILYIKNPDYDEPLFPPLTALVDSYYQGNGCDDILNFVEMVQNGKDERKEQRNKLFNKCVPHFDGKCGERIKEDIINSINAAYINSSEIKIVIFGTGFMYNKIMSFFKFPAYCKVIALSDNNKDKWGQHIDGVKVFAPNEIINLNFDKIIIMVANVFEEQVYHQLSYELEIPKSKIEFCEYIGGI